MCVRVRVCSTPQIRLRTKEKKVHSKIQNSQSNQIFPVIPRPFSPPSMAKVTVLVRRACMFDVNKEKKIRLEQCLDCNAV